MALHDLGGKDHAPSTLAELNALITDADLTSSLVHSIFVPNSRPSPTVPYRTLSDGETEYFTFVVPSSFTTIVSTKVYSVPDTTNASADVDLTSSYGAIGETVSQHSDSNTGSTYNLTANNIFGFDASGLLASLAAGDMITVGIQWNVAAENLRVYGLLFEYS